MACLLECLWISALAWLFPEKPLHTYIDVFTDSCFRLMGAMRGSAPAV
jgi:hypothetical protein